jgi:hypothetical protein
MTWFLIGSTSKALLKVFLLQVSMLCVVAAPAIPEVATVEQAKR